MRHTQITPDGMAIAYFDWHEKIEADNLIITPDGMDYTGRRYNPDTKEWSEFILPPNDPPAELPAQQQIIYEVSAAQAKLALFNNGLLDKVEALVKAHPYEPVRIWFNNANVWNRSNPYLAGVAQELDLTDEQVDKLFTSAYKL